MPRGKQCLNHCRGSNYRRSSPTSLLRHSQCTHPPTSNGPTALPLQNKEGLQKTLPWPADCQAFSTRRGAVLLARLRAGHTPLLRAYTNQLDTTVDPKCHSCGEEPQTVEHWLQRCPNAVALRHQLFSEPSPPLSVLTTNPGRVLAVARKTFP